MLLGFSKGSDGMVDGMAGETKVTAVTCRTYRKFAFMGV
jgi:hypothetical protein